jgi:choline dehydrogenase
MEYNYIIVGAGSAGAILATRLTENPHISVILLESGPDYPDYESLPDEIRIGNATGADIITKNHNYRFWGNPTPIAKPMPVPRGRVTGGSSAINGQVFLRGMPEDYDNWADKGNDKWSYEKTLPYFRKLETDLDYDGDFHGSNGPIIARRYKKEEWISSQKAFYNACKEQGLPDGYDQNHPDVTGVGPTPFNNPNNVRWSTNLGYLSMARHRLNLTIRSSCTTKRILFNETKAIGVEVESNGEIFRLHGDNIFVCAGAIGSPQLLMLSGIGPYEQLNRFGIPIVKDLQGVGQNLRDHPILAITFTTKENHLMNPNLPRAQIMARYTATDSIIRNDIKLAMNSFAISSEGHDGDVNIPVGVRILVSLQLATSSGQLLLDSNDINVQPILNYNYYSTDFDLKRGREGVLKAIEIADSFHFKDIIKSRISPSDFDIESESNLNTWILKNVTTNQHISSTCKMGPENDYLSVVNQEGQVHGIKNLRVIDASIMPDSVRANINVTTMMIAERIYSFL